MTNYWKTIAGRCIYQTPQSVSVHQNLVYRWLTFNNQSTLQTLIHRHHPERPALSYLVPFTYALLKDPGPACLLGLGGAGVAHYAGPYLGSIPVTAIEANREVIDIASTYFGTDALANLSILHQDALTFVSSCKERYQHILIDIYSDSGFPLHCQHIDFFIACKALLLPNGVLALNLVNIEHEFGIFIQLRTLFNNATVCIPVNGCANMIILASDSLTHLLQLLQQSPKLKTLIWDEHYGCMARLR